MFPRSQLVAVLALISVSCSSLPSGGECDPGKMYTCYSGPAGTDVSVHACVYTEKPVASMTTGLLVQPGRFAVFP